jgi:hypothetical protein
MARRKGKDRPRTLRSSLALRRSFFEQQYFVKPDRNCAVAEKFSHQILMAFRRDFVAKPRFDDDPCQPKDAARQSGWERHMRGNLTETVRELARSFAHLLDPYRPELHYMRGPGPKWHAKRAGAATNRPRPMAETIPGLREIAKARA